jgi:hypothetical protein
MPFEKALDQVVTVEQPICRHLLAKSMYLSGTRELPPGHNSAGHCWCNLTQDVRGPDSQLVQPRACNSNRTCYDPVV